VIRKFNYTGRKSIRRSAVRIELLRDSDHRRYFSASVSLDGLSLPPNGRVYVEAYHRSGYQRFDFGTVADPAMPADRRLTRFAEAVVPLFRVKVVDRSETHGRILAAVDKIRPKTAEDEPAGGQSLLFVEYDDLGDVVWALDLESDWPVLRLNKRAEEISLIASADQRFLSLVYPEVVRQILSRIVIEDDHLDPHCDDDWPSLWLQMACRVLGVPEPPSGTETEKAAWVERAVEAFGSHHDMLKKFHQGFQNAK